MYLISYKKINHSEKLLNSDVDLLLTFVLTDAFRSRQTFTEQ